MADAISIQELIDARTDAKTLEEAVNGDAVTTVLSRLGETYPTLSNALNQIDSKLDSADTQIKQGITNLFENGGLPATPFATKALMESSELVDGDYAMVTDDSVADDNGLYIKTAGVWVKSDYDPVGYTDSKLLNSLKYFDTAANLKESTPTALNRYAFAKDEGAYYASSDASRSIQPETTALLTRFEVKPSAADEAVINRLIYDLKDAGVWQKLDGLWISRTTSFDDSKLNFVSSSNNLTLEGTKPTATWVAATSKWKAKLGTYTFDTGLNLSSSNNKFSQNDISVGVLLYGDDIAENPVGAFNGTGGVTLTKLTDGVISRLNQNNSYHSYNVKPVGDDFTLVAASRKNDLISNYSNGELLSSTALASSAPLNETIKIGRIDSTNISNGAVYAVFVGAALTDNEVNLTNQALKLYATLFSRTGGTVLEWVKIGDNDSNAVSNYVFNGETTAVTPTANLTGVVDESIINQEYMGGYIEIQPDSWTGTHNTATDATTETWGFPQSLTHSEQARLRKDLFKGDGKGLQYIRFPLGFAYRGYRNIDETTGLARNIGERYLGQDAALRKLFADISKAGGGLAPEYWCPPVHWLTSGSYHGDNRITAGGSYSRSTTLASIRTSDPVQYAAQIDAFTDAVVDDYEYLHQNIAPVRMYGLSNEPAYPQMMYGACSFDAETYSDIILALHPKVQSSAILSEWNGEPNKVLLHVASDDHAPYWSRAAKLEAEHPEYIWGYTHHMIRLISGEKTVAGAGKGGDYYKSTDFAEAIGTRKNVFLNEYEYFSPMSTTHTYKCSNNMLAYINSVIYSDSRLIMPIIHVSKQLGATSFQTNTEGYALTQVNLQEVYGLAPNDPTNTTNAGYGTYRPVDHNYNAWRFIADNLPIGAVRIGGVPANNLARVNYVVYKFENKLIVLIANSNAKPVDVTLSFSKSRAYNGKIYNIDKCGAVLKPKDGQTITFTIPAHSGQAWVEV